MQDKWCSGGKMQAVAAEPACMGKQSHCCFFIREHL